MAFKMKGITPFKQTEEGKMTKTTGELEKDPNAKRIAEIKAELAKYVQEEKDNVQIDRSGEIESLKKVVPNMGKDGETCAHGNSWHSGCSECESMTELDVVFALVETFPNDAELGFKVREMYNLYNNSDDTTE